MSGYLEECSLILALSFSHLRALFFVAALGKMRLLCLLTFRESYGCCFLGFCRTMCSGCLDPTKEEISRWGWTRSGISAIR